MNRIELVREFVVENFLFGDGDKLADDTDFLENGVIDSTGVLELINYLEATFTITIEDEEVTPENLDSLLNISRYLELKLNGGGVKCAV
jgi:acyl carrier protein